MPRRYGPWKTVYNRFRNWAMRNYCLDRLEFHDERTPDEKIHSSLASLMPLVQHAHTRLLFGGDIPKPQLHSQGLLIHGLEKTRPELTVHLGCGTDHSSRQLIELRRRFSKALSWACLERLVMAFPATTTRQFPPSETRDAPLVPTPPLALAELGDRRIVRAALVRPGARVAGHAAAARTEARAIAVGRSALTAVDEVHGASLIRGDRCVKKTALLDRLHSSG